MLPSIEVEESIILSSYSLGKLAQLTQELQRYKRELGTSEQESKTLQAELNEVRNENEQLTKKCHTLNAQRDDASGKYQKSVSVLKDSEKRQRETESKNKELSAKIQELQELLLSEKELKQKLKVDTEKLKEENRRLEDYGRKLEEEKERLHAEKSKAEKDNEHLKTQNDILKYQANQQRESSHEMHRTYSDLTGKYRQMQRRHTSKSEGDVAANVASQASDHTITSLREQSNNHSVGTCTTTQSVQTTTGSQQKVVSPFQDKSPESNS